MTETIKSTRGCSAGGCSGCSSKKLNVFDWLNDTPLGINSQDIVEIQFKSTNKDFFYNENKIKLQKGDYVAVEAVSGHDIGTISASGEIVLKQMKKKRISPKKEFKKVYRIAKDTDIQKWNEAIDREEPVMLKARKIALSLNLDMKIGDVEFQGDGSKAIFYYIADKRVDFRELIRVLASEFRIRIEMKQIGARQEAGRIGGIGSCGRELCCSSWKTDFDSVSTDAARLQELGINPQKLTGQCGKLKCCLNFEIDNYIDALSKFPSKRSIESKEGRATYSKQDIMKGTMLYTMERNSLRTYINLGIDRVREIQKMNKEGKLPETLLEVVEQEIVPEDGYSTIVGDSLTRFDNVKTKRKRQNKKKIAKSKNTKVNIGATTENPAIATQKTRLKKRTGNSVKSREKTIKTENKQVDEKTTTEKKIPVARNRPNRHKKRREISQNKNNKEDDKA